MVWGNIITGSDEGDDWTKVHYRSGGCIAHPSERVFHRQMEQIARLRRKLSNQKSSSRGVALFAGGRKAGRGKGEGGGEQENLARGAEHFYLLTPIFILCMFSIQKFCEIFTTFILTGLTFCRNRSEEFARCCLL